MPDISMCSGGDCSFKENCYRYKAKADKYWQSYFLNPPFNNNDCQYYWPIIEDKKPVMPCQTHDKENDSDT